jgi:general secretion pathway protein K
VRRQEGFVLVIVLFFAALLFTGVATFLRRATVDAYITRNQDQAARAEALARGGVRMAVVLLLQDLVAEQDESSGSSETSNDLWAQLSGVDLPVPDGGRLRVQIEDAGSRLNVNALFGPNVDADRREAFLEAFLEKVVEEMPGRPEEKLYDPGELAQNLIDYVDEDDVRLSGGYEDEYYQQQDPPYRAANHPLLSVAEVALVEGFDEPLLRALEPYLTVYPYTGGGGINPNTAPPWLLASLYVGTGSDYELAGEDEIRDVLRARDKGELLCPDGEEGRAADCTFVRGVVGGEIFPPPAWRSDVFRVVAEASYGEVRREIEAVVDRGEPTEPRFLAWRVR